MKKKNILLLLVLCITCLFALCACNTSDADADNVIAIELVANSSDVEIGSFSVSNYSLNLTYQSGKIENVPLTSEMISDTESLKFYTFGTKEVTFSAYDLNCQHTFNVVQKQIKNAYLVGFTKNPTTQIYERVEQYTGEPFDITVDGDIPAGAKISFSNGSSSFTDVNSYSFTVYITCDSYETKQIQANFTISKAVYDMSGVHFKNVDGDTVHVTYSGEEAELSLEGEIPEGVTPTFKIQSLKSSEYLDSWPITAGNYLVSASFEADTVSHEKIKDITTYLIIDKKEVVLNNISFEDQEIVYDGSAHTFKLTNESLLTDKSSTLSNLVTFEYESNVLTNAGSYIAKANFSVLDTINYTVVDSLKANITIKKADYDLSNVVFDSDSIVYDKANHGIEILFKTDKDGNKTGLPKGVVASYSINGTVVDYTKGEGVSNAGTHTVVVSFTHSNTNYNAIPDMEALLRIEQAEISFDSLQFVQKDGSILPDNIEYTGESYEPKLNALPDGIKSVKYTYEYISGSETKTVDKCVEARNYTLVADFTEIDSNYYCNSSFSRPFEISVLVINDSNLTFDYSGLTKVDDEVFFDYDATEHSIKLKDTPDAVTSVKYIIKNANTSALANGDMPGEYYQETQITYYNGLEQFTYTTSSTIPFTITFVITNTDFTFSSTQMLYSGDEIYPEFVWNTSSENYSLIQSKFATINYFFKKSGTNDDYSEVCPTDVGQYDVKAVFSSYLTGKNGENTFDNVIVTMTIDKRILTADDIMQAKIANVSTGDVKEAACQYKETWTFNGYDGTEVTDFSCSDVYVQEFNYKYDGKKRSVVPITNLTKLINVYESKVTCYRLIGNTSTGDYSTTECIKDVQMIQVKTDADILNLTDAGWYVYKFDFKVNSNCELSTNCGMYVQIKIDVLEYDVNYFKSQNVLKNFTDPCEFDTSIIPFKLNAKISKYEYKDNTSKTKPLSYADAVESSMAYVDTSTTPNKYYYYVIFTISFETSNQSIYKQSFADALTETENTTTGICYMKDKGEDAGYHTYEFKVRIEYID